MRSLGDAGRRDAEQAAVGRLGKCAFAFAVEAFLRSSAQNPVMPLVAALLGAIYVAVRGFDNLDQHRVALSKSKT
ncbi:hypothetical protein [Massilia sp. erpn]|uniref:hypothetical protein n=1 Tax=Massilia sp. erpn TaxID=2738142 RepID=UPI00210840CB|nr:hypothetical protein [Massilia sp. erpn]UTY59267.1 hypothetical protein HPQ68_20050 [Massilia sp. erpn]